MNERIDEKRSSIGEAELRLALRGLRQGTEPAADLWPGIAARIAALPQHAPTTSPRPHQRWLWPLATAASLLLVVGVTWKMQPVGPVSVMSATPIANGPQTARMPLVQREAETLTVQYQAALRELDAHATPAGWQPGLDALDRSAAEIRDALQRDPNSRLLLQRLRDTYTRRLALSRRALYA
ncbi:hypothetical protein [Thermomonas sp. HDW16]|uniref:hypothetical protein n=1 Tax=Thermomonas sp. HDW16 TaxID=2714945 RepID=UPI00140D1006|nr:hypothetical protein [Thermomonas sp. HDW16]QIL19988.1 hypothetical protein G7079_04150 [Thermomonas sp. HDW16]